MNEFDVPGTVASLQGSAEIAGTARRAGESWPYWTQSSVARILKQGGQMTEPARVLIVDEDGQSNGTAVSALAAAGYDVQAVSSISDVFAALSERAPDVIIVSAERLIGRGDDLATTLFHFYFTHAVPIIVLRHDEAHSPELLPACARLAKPVVPSDLVDMVSGCLSSLSLNDGALALTSEAVRIQEEERRKLSAELHDDVAQVLGNLVLMMDACLALEPGATELLRRHLANARETAKEGFRRVKRFSVDLRPPMLDDLGLVPTIAWYVQRFELESGIGVQVDLPPSLSSLSGEQETAVFRIVQESLRNVDRHAAAKHARVTMVREASALRLTISDDGIGFEREEVAKKLADGTHLGLAGMRNRVASLHGNFSISSIPGNGTTVTVDFPVSGC